MPRLATSPLPFPALRPRARGIYRFPCPDMPGCVWVEAWGDGGTFLHAGWSNEATVHAEADEAALTWLETAERSRLRPVA